MKSFKLEHIEEPLLTFGQEQAVDSPKEGLFLFGPIEDERKPHSMRIGVIGTNKGVTVYEDWLQRINALIPAKEANHDGEISFPGFEAIFKTKWSKPVTKIIIPEYEIQQSISKTDARGNNHIAVYETVSLYEQRITDTIREEDLNVDIWFVIISEEIYQRGRPKSSVPRDERIKDDSVISSRRAKILRKEPSLFDYENEAADIYSYEKNFHHQLKARLLGRAVLQIVRESTLLPQDNDRIPTRSLQDEASVAWNLCTTAFYKASGRPWKLHNIRENVCYIGLVFKLDSVEGNKGKACCGAQMFLDSGESLVFKGAVGDWYSPENKEFHLSKEKARELLSTVINAYKREHNIYPAELFIHGKTWFNNDEWEGFQEAVKDETKLVGVRITPSKDIKLYTLANHAILRGTAYLQNEKSGFLWTRGFVPKLGTYQGRETPNPLRIEISRGKADLKQVMQDIMGLTKVNFNSCIYADGYPVTLRFADAVGEILTAAPLSEQIPPLPFKHYI